MVQSFPCRPFFCLWLDWNTLWLVAQLQEIPLVAVGVFKPAQSKSSRHGMGPEGALNSLALVFLIVECVGEQRFRAGHLIDGFPLLVQINHAEIPTALFEDFFDRR